jgi:flagellar biosynthesis/type III secretory pathway chaperone
LVDRLIEILEEEAETYNRFLELAREKTDIIINGNIVKLEDITKREHILADEMGKFEEAREEVMAEIIPHLDKDFSADNNLSVDKEYLADKNISEFTITSIIEYLRGIGKKAKFAEIREQNIEQLNVTQVNATQADIEQTVKTDLLHREKHHLMQIEKLEKFKENIIAIVNELKEINEINSDLIKNSLEYINFSINLITSANGHRTKYNNDGKEGNVERRSLFDVKL